MTRNAQKLHKRAAECLEQYGSSWQSRELPAAEAFVIDDARGDVTVFVVNADVALDADHRVLQSLTDAARIQGRVDAYRLARSYAEVLQTPVQLSGYARTSVWTLLVHPTGTAA